MGLQKNLERGTMKTLFSNLLVSGLLVSSSFNTHAAPSMAPAKGNKVAATTAVHKVASAPGDGKPKAEDAPAANNPILEAVLNQVMYARLFITNFEAGTVERNVEGKMTEVATILALKAAGVIKFKKDIKINFGDDKKTQAQLRKAIPGVQATTNDLQVVLEVKIQEKGTARVRFCQNYRSQTDECDATKDGKFLDLNFSSETFDVTSLRLKEININFTQNLGEGNFAFDGTCDAWMPIADRNSPDKVVLAQAICKFSGVFDSRKSAPKWNFKLGVKP